MTTAPSNRDDAPLRRVRAQIPTDADAPAEARRTLGPLAAALPVETADVLELVASELVTNSVRHSGVQTGTPIGLEASVDAGVVRLSVHDRGRGFHGTAGAEPGAMGGWGLQVVHGLVDRWWIEIGEGTRVVCEVGR